MKLLKILLIIIGILVLSAVILGLTGPRDYHVTRAISVPLPKEMVFPYLSSLQKNQLWSPWAEKDPNMRSFFEGVEGTVGSLHRWEGNNDVGKGEQRVLNVVANEAVDSELKFYLPWGESVSTSYFRIEDDGSGASKITWGFQGENHGIIERAMARIFNFEDAVGSDFENGLQKLADLMKEKSEKDFGGFQIQRIHFPGRKFVAIRDEVRITDLQNFYMQALPLLGRFVTRSGVEMDGMPCGLYFTFDEPEGMTDLAGAIGIKSPVSLRDPIEEITISPGDALQLDYYGDYDGLTKAHDALSAYLEEWDIQSKPPIIEEYVTDPTTEPDTSKWLTTIIYLLN